MAAEGRTSVRDVSQLEINVTHARKCFSLEYLTLHTENDLILFSSTERKNTVLVHLQITFTVDLHRLKR